MIRKVEHVALIVKNMDEAIQFYCEMFGYQLRSRGNSKTREMSFLTHENQPGFEIELIQDLVPQGDYAESGIVNHLAFTVDHMEEAIAYYREKGVQFETEQPSQNYQGAKIIFFYGPNRELLQLVEPAKRL